MKYCVRPAHDKKTLKILHVPTERREEGETPVRGSRMALHYFKTRYSERGRGVARENCGDTELKAKVLMLPGVNLRHILLTTLSEEV